MSTDDDDDKRVVLNVGGMRNETRVSTLNKIPFTRLSYLVKMLEKDEAYDHTKREYFFDRNPAVFSMILEYYRGNELHIDQNICGNIVKRELDFWGINESSIEVCCWGAYSKFQRHKDTLANLDAIFGPPQPDPKELPSASRWHLFLYKGHVTLEHPSSSRLAMVIFIISLCFVIMSITTFVMESHYWFRVIYINGTQFPAPNPDLESNGNSACIPLASSNVSQPPSEPHPHFEYVNWILQIFFTFELCASFIFSMNKRKFWCDALIIMDVMCLLPQYICLVIQKVYGNNSAPAVLRVTMVMRVLRVLRVFKLLQHYGAFKILVYTIKVSARELLLMVVFLMTGVIVFASVIYYAETDNFTSIPIGFWWALVTMTTVGYGDKYPRQPAGYVVGSMCLMCGVLVIAFTVPIVVNNFGAYYTHALSRINTATTAKPKLAAVAPYADTRMNRVPTSNVREYNGLSEESTTTLNESFTSMCNNAAIENLNIKYKEEMGKAEHEHETLSSSFKIENAETGNVFSSETKHVMDAKQLFAIINLKQEQTAKEQEHQYKLTTTRLNSRKQGNQHNLENNFPNESQCASSVPASDTPES